ncbi:hypothetical protein IMX07_14705 [bacterium]|nr:hypothetical protein [bacterium]
MPIPEFAHQIAERIANEAFGAALTAEASIDKDRRVESARLLRRIDGLD